MNNVAHLAYSIRDDKTNKVHVPGEEVTILASMREVGTHRTILKASFVDGSTKILLPSDIVEPLV